MAVEQYRQYIQELLLERAERSASSSANSQTETQVIFDVERDRYQLLGQWHQRSRSS